MAFNLLEKYKNIDCDYWKIIRIIHDVVSNKLIVNIGLYQNEASRTDNVNNFVKTERLVFDYSMTTSIDTLDNVVSSAYVAIKNGEYENAPTEIVEENGKEVEKKINKFKDAQDVLTQKQKGA